METATPRKNPEKKKKTPQKTPKPNRNLSQNLQILRSFGGFGTQYFPILPDLREMVHRKRVNKPMKVGILPSFLDDVTPTSTIAISTFMDFFSHNRRNPSHPFLWATITFKHGGC